ncbi:hypothetical protein [Moorena sp. SIO3I6]|uniref:hypothetical protein n=1 Tax=Moorena sp. SIO3I6 TaxID=2607831 RepID=UPI0013FCF3CF|nr:hypothetical protein [Moorena sp. SIO3I6]NEP26721.1 hypothetical protein [Moorena sp. SIO3I6]
MGRWGDGEMGRWGDLTGVGFLHLGRESGVGNRESEPTPNPSQEGKSGKWGELSRKSWCILIHIGINLHKLMVYFDRYG